MHEPALSIQSHLGHADHCGTGECMGGVIALTRDQSILARSVSRIMTASNSSEAAVIGETGPHFSSLTSIAFLQASSASSYLQVVVIVSLQHVLQQAQAAFSSAVGGAAAGGLQVKPCASNPGLRLPA